MVQLIVGKKGKGKTKYLLEKANQEIKTTTGSIVYLDKSTKHMYELNTKIRLINAMEFAMKSSDEFIGFLLGILSQDHDIEQLYLDSFLKITTLEDIEGDLNATLKRIEAISEEAKVDFILSISVDECDLADEFKSKVIVSL